MAHYTVETAKVDPLVEKAVAAASAGIRGPLSLLQAKATTVLERATADANRMIVEAAAAASAEMEEMMRDAVRNAAVGLAADFRMINESKNYSDVTADLEPYINPASRLNGGPMYLTRKDGINSECKSSYTVMIQDCDYNGWVLTIQAWDHYGDCVLLDKCRNYGNLDWSTYKVPAIGMRAKLTPEYQDILWEVAKKMDASFLRPIFDKYHPSAPELERLQFRNSSALGEKLLWRRANKNVSSSKHSSSEQQKKLQNALAQMHSTHLRPIMPSMPSILPNSKVKRLNSHPESTILISSARNSQTYSKLPPSDCKQRMPRRSRSRPL